MNISVHLYVSMYNFELFGFLYSAKTTLCSSLNMLKEESNALVGRKQLQKLPDSIEH